MATGVLRGDTARAGWLKETLLHEAEVEETDDAAAVEVGMEYAQQSGPSQRRGRSKRFQ